MVKRVNLLSSILNWTQIYEINWGSFIKFLKALFLRLPFNGTFPKYKDILNFSVLKKKSIFTFFQKHVLCKVPGKGIIWIFPPFMIWWGH